MGNLSRLFAVCCLLLVVGCASFDPLSFDITPSDRETYVDKCAPQNHGDQFKILVVSKAMANKDDPSKDKMMAESARASVMKYFSNLGWFETIDEKNGIALDVGDLIGEDGRANQKALDNTEIDFILSVRSSVSYPAHHFKWHEFWGHGRYTYSSSKANGADVTTEFALIQACDNKPILSGRFRSRRLCDSSYTVAKSIDAATDANARKFAQIVASRFLPPARVLETRGGGRCARIRMGENYMVGPETDEQPATVVEFFVYEEGVEKDAAGKPVVEKVPFARGTVVKAVNNRECWVAVDNWKKANVRKGHFVRVSEETIREVTKDEF